jgi:hypothetical protein
MKTPGLTPGITRSSHNNEDDPEPSIHTPFSIESDIHTPSGRDDTDITFKGRGGTKLANLFNNKAVEPAQVTESGPLKDVVKAAKSDANPPQMLKNVLIKNYGYNDGTELLNKGVKVGL